MLDDEARAAIRRLDLASKKASILSKADIDAMPQLTTLHSLRKRDIDALQASDDFQRLLNILAKTATASHQDMEPPKKRYQIDEPIKSLGEGGFGLFLATTIEESPNLLVLKYLVSCAPYPTADGWPGNPIGNLAKNDHAQDFLLNGKTYIYDYIYSDEFYTSLDIVVPVLNDDGSPLAFLGVDYAATKERNRLLLLQYFCFAVVISSLVISAAGSIYIARKLSVSLQQLTSAAERVAASDLDFSLAIQSKDEFATLGHAFNRMVRSIREYTRDLEEKQNQLTTVVEDMHDGVGAILTGIIFNTGKSAVQNCTDASGTATRLQTVNHLAREGLVEVRFLMSALESDLSSFSALIEEIRMQGIDILQPSGITLDFQTVEITGEEPITFQAFLQLQRLFREAFVNIIKHSDADFCQVALQGTPATLAITIQDNGSQEKVSGNPHGHGLHSMKRRVEKMEGSFSFLLSDGFRIHIILPRHSVIAAFPEKPPASSGTMLS